MALRGHYWSGVGLHRGLASSVTVGSWLAAGLKGRLPGISLGKGLRPALIRGVAALRSTCHRDFGVPGQQVCSSWAWSCWPAGGWGRGRGGCAVHGLPLLPAQDHCLSSLGEEVQRLSKLEVQVRRKDEEILALQEEREALKKQLRDLRRSKVSEAPVCQGTKVSRARGASRSHRDADSASSAPQPPADPQGPGVYPCPLHRPGHPGRLPGPWGSSGWVSGV